MRKIDMNNFNSICHSVGVRFALLVSLSLFFSSCSVNRITTSRIYYDFSKKELYDDSLKQVKSNRPISSGENSEVQIEISKFNQLSYGVGVEDTAYDLFKSSNESSEKIANFKFYNDEKLTGVSNTTNAEKGTGGSTALFANDQSKDSTCIKKNDSLRTSLENQGKSLQKQMLPASVVNATLNN